MNLNIISEQFLDVGIKCYTCDNAKQALSMLREATEKGAPFELAVLDFMMPEMDGEVLAREIRKSKNGISDLPLVILTSIGERGYVSRFAAAGFSAVLSKPCSHSTLLDTVAHVYSTHKNSDTSRLVSVEGNIVSNSAEGPLGVNVQNMEGHRPLAGTRVLLVEDNTTNRMMAEEMLEELGCFTTSIENGELAVAAVMTLECDIVLMDVQMPVMDGLEATSRIRELEKADELEGHIPIIALTANAMKGDKEKCIAAGMDDYLSKPVRRRELESIIKKWVLKKEEIDGVVEEEEVVKPNILMKEINKEIVLIDQSIFDESKSIMKDRFSEILRFYFEDTKNYIDQIQKGLDDQEFEKIISQAHTIKSSSKQLGFIAVSDIAMQIEKYARNAIDTKNTDFDFIEENFLLLKKYFEKIENDQDNLMS